MQVHRRIVMQQYMACGRLYATKEAATEGRDASCSLTRDGQRHTTNPQGIADSQYAEHREGKGEEGVRAIDRK